MLASGAITFRQIVRKSLFSCSPDFSQQNYESFRNFSCKSFRKFPKRSKLSSSHRNGLVAKMSESKTSGLLEEFEVIFSAKANDVHEVTKYRSRSTGLEVVHAAIEGPIVNGFIVLATRAEDDDGLPHTLEHLIFLGSDEYPYKGVLDVLANKCLASGTNAWTDVDHTCYTLTTAGSEGFYNLLPIYMDHIFHPVLTDNAFTTEVYHTTGKGTDGGVVYSELQAIENSAEELTHYELVRNIYPPTSGYHYNSGGVMKNLRESCNNTKVREFHKKFYNPRNTCLIVCGMVDPAKLFSSLEHTIKKLTEKGIIESWTKPWLEDVAEIERPLERKIKFPTDEVDDDEVLVTVGFRGPSAVNEVELVAAMRLLFEYLTDSSVGPFQLEFVENDDPICSGVSFSEMENSRTTFYFEFEAVTPETMSEVVPKMRATLEKQVANFDMIRMVDIIRKNFQEELSSMENTPHNSIAYAVIGDFLYGSDEKAVFEKRINGAATISKFLEKPVEFWASLIKDRILGQKWITIFAEPSKAAYKTISMEEKARVEERIGRLGEPGMEKLAFELQEAMRLNATPAPDSILEKMNVPCTQSITYHNITRIQNPDWAKDVKCNLYVDDIKSNFVYISVLMDTSSLNLQQRKYLALLRELLVESPILRDDGTTMSFEEVVADLGRTWLSYGCSVGIDGGGRFKCGSYSHTFSLTNQMELNKVEEGFDWIRKLLWKTQWTAERMKVVANKMAGDVAQMKRKGGRMAFTCVKDLIYQSDSNVKATSMIRQHKFLKDLSSSLPKSEKKLKEMFESIRSVITNPANMTVHIATSLDKLNAKVAELSCKDLGTLLSKTFAFPGDAVVEKRLANERDTKWMKDIKTFKSKPEQVILGLGAEDSSFLVQLTPGPTDSMDPELPILLTTMQYFCQTEGPFYRGIRGAGFAYDFYMDNRTTEGLIYFNLFRCADVVGAYAAAKEIVIGHLDKKIEWNEEFLTSAKSSLIFEYIEGEKTPLSLASTSLCSYYRNVPDGYTRSMIEKISAVTVADLQPIAEKYFRPLFFENYVCAVVCPSDKVSGIAGGFSKLGKELKIMTGIQKSYLESWDA